MLLVQALIRGLASDGKKDDGRARLMEMLAERAAATTSEKL